MTTNGPAGSTVNSSDHGDVFWEAFGEVLDAREACRPVDRAAFRERFPTLTDAEIEELLEITSPLEEIRQGEGGTRTVPGYIALESFNDYVVDPGNHYLDQGGLNSVHRVLDTRFHRKLAVKVPLVKFMGDPDVRRHLEREALICARLQHPNIVPVYEMGHYRGLCPFFSMKLVEGTTLLSLLQERGDPGERLVYFLSIFKQICEAIAYAHSEGVTHRDLKPGNIMVGRFNEVHVMDWGFVQVLADPEESVSPRLRKILWASQAMGSDSVFATVAYMAPEMARPVKETMTEKTDGFGLGGILTHILTGRPVYIGHPKGEIWRLAREGKAAEARMRLASCTADRDLVAIAVGALAERPDDRPSAERLAVDVQNYIDRIEGQKVQAERRAKHLTIWLSAAVMTLLLIFGGGWYLLDREARHKAEVIRKTRIANDVNSALVETFKAIDDKAYFRGDAALQRAKGRLGLDDDPALRNKVADAERFLSAVLDLDEIRQERSVLNEDPILPVVPALLRYAARFRALGYDPGDPGTISLIKASPIRPAIVEALDDWATYEQNKGLQNRLLTLARAVDPDATWGDRFRDPSVRNDPTKIAALAESIPKSALSISQTEALVNSLPVESDGALRLLRTAEARHPNDFWLVYTAARRLSTARSDDFETNRSLHREAIGYARTALAIRPDSLAAALMLVQICEKENRPEEIERIAQHVGRQNRESWLKEAVLAIADQTRGNFIDAIDRWKRIDQMVSNNDYAKRRMISNLLSVGHLDDATNYADAILSRTPHDSQALRFKAGILMQRAQSEPARKLLLEAISYNKKDGNILLMFAAALFMEGRLIDCGKVLDMAKATKIDSAEYMVLDAFICLFRGDNTAALERITHCIRIQPAYHARLILAFTLIHCGKFKEAREVFRESRKHMDANSVTFPAMMTTLVKPLFAYISLVIDNFCNMEDYFADTILNLHGNDDDVKISILMRLALPALGEYFYTHEQYAISTSLFDIAAHPGSFMSRHGGTNLIGSIRITAAKAAAKAWSGGGRDAFQTTDADRAKYRDLALSWLELELETCRNYAVNPPTAMANIQGKAFGLKPFTGANFKVHILLMNRDLEALRDPEIIKFMPEAARKRAEHLWEGIRQLYTQLNPPIDLPLRALK